MPDSAVSLALVTGASSGIGFELARRFAKDGRALVIAARHADALNRAAEALRMAGAPRVEAVPVDLSTPEGAPYVETDAPNPVNADGRSKAEGERRVLAAGGRTLVVWSATFFSPYDSENFAIDGETGIWHVTNRSRMSWAEFARTLAEHAGFDPGAVRALPAIDRFLVDTRQAAKRRTPKSPADDRDPVLAEFAAA